MHGSGTYDAVVGGGGHNGLVCAAYLARAGLRRAGAQAGAVARTGAGARRPS